jgi:hypothetical protein
MKLYTIYSPPEHRDGVIHATKEDAMERQNGWIRREDDGIAEIESKKALTNRALLNCDGNHRLKACISRLLKKSWELKIKS